MACQPKQILVTAACAPIRNPEAGRSTDSERVRGCVGIERTAMLRNLMLVSVLASALGCDGTFPTARADGGVDAVPAIDTEIAYCGDGYHRVAYPHPELVFCSPLDGVGRDHSQCGPNFTPVDIGAGSTVLCVPPSPAP
jgi:hypothetical protein